jgi:hypothetical protein
MPAHPELLEPLHGAREAPHAHVLVEVQRAEDGGEARRCSEFHFGFVCLLRRSLRLLGLRGLLGGLCLRVGRSLGLLVLLSLLRLCLLGLLGADLLRRLRLQRMRALTEWEEL